MRRTIFKLFWAWDFEKEEKWINEMSIKGLHLCGVGLCKYVFDEGTPGEYIHRMEMLDKAPAHPESMQYIRFIEDTGAEHIGSLMRWVYFRKKTGGSGFDLFSSLDSRISHLNRILLIFGILLGFNIFSSINNLGFWLSSGITVNLIIVFIHLIFTAWLGYGFIRLYLKKCKLKKQKILHE